MKIATAFAVATIVALGATSVIAQQDPIAARKALMKANGQNAGALAKMTKGEAPFDAAKVQAAFAQWAETAKKLPGLFPDSSQAGDTRAQPAVWTDRPKFDATVAKFAKDVADNRSKVTDVDSLKVAMGVVGKDCGACHETFRKPQ